MHIICDLYMTLADSSERLSKVNYDPSKPVDHNIDWGDYSKDRVIKPTREIINRFFDLEYKIIILTGRVENECLVASK